MCPLYAMSSSHLNEVLTYALILLLTSLLPTFTLKIYRGNLTAQNSCLVGTGTQRSYISAAAAKRIGVPINNYDPTVFVSTYLNTESPNFYEVSQHVDLCDGLTKFSTPLPVEENLYLKLGV